ncbi:MAG TPA: hypothetical protein ENJ00_05715 [Phycisphaerales bacterium]|nr:hypothetical protein [Phycisphaerales bacterium]
MGPGIIIVVVGIFIVLIVLGSIADRKARLAREEALGRLADRIAFSFDPFPDPSHDERYRRFPIFRLGHSRQAYNTLAGQYTINNTPHPVKMGDYLYKVTSSNGKTTTTTTYRLSYLLVHLPYPMIPDLFIRPENFFDKIGSALGFDDIDFESAEFSKKFLVKSSDKRFAYNVISPAMMEFLLASPRQTIDMRGGIICIVTGNRRWKPEEFPAKLEWTAKFIDLWPDFVLEDLRTVSA